jgi:3-deoxy-D-manno-octulosonic-acid transferase
MFRVYQIVLMLALPLVWLRLQWRARREPAYGHRQAERFGRVPPAVRPHCIWFHTVSAGETIAAAPLISEIAQEFNSTPVLVTTMTPTGSDQVLSRLGECVDHCYAPYDFDFAVQKFYATVQPRILILMETELWPNLISHAYRLRIPVVLVNARLSERSARGYQRVINLTRPMLQQLSTIACQSDEHVARFVSLGADPNSTQALGSVKYDVSLPEGFDRSVARLRRALAIGERPVLIAASTHPGEDEPVVSAFKKLRQRFPELCLLLVPRHPVRAHEVGELVAAAGYTWVLQSDCAASEPPAPTDVIVGDVMGTLLTLYGVADVAFVGGSLVEMGGHNVLEPALCQVPILCGPFQFNFTEVMQVLQDSGGLVTVTDEQTLADAASVWFADTASRHQAGAAAAAALMANRGATQRVKELLRGHISAVL